MTACIEGELKTILHAEDDDLVRKLMAKNLSRLGYRLISAVDGQDAVAQFITHREEIRLLLLDHTTSPTQRPQLARDPHRHAVIDPHVLDRTLPRAVLQFDRARC